MTCPGCRSPLAPAALPEVPAEEVVQALKQSANDADVAHVGSVAVVVGPPLPAAPPPDFMRVLSMMTVPVVVFYFGLNDNSICRFTGGWAELLSPQEGLRDILSCECLVYVIAGGALGSVRPLSPEDSGRGRESGTVPGSLSSSFLTPKL